MEEIPGMEREKELTQFDGTALSQYSACLVSEMYKMYGNWL